MVEFTIGNICKEIQRIRFDIKCGEYESAIDRCDNLDDLLCDIGDGKHNLSLESKVFKSWKGEYDDWE